jgi:hypothetical protein
MRENNGQKLFTHLNWVVGEVVLCARDRGEGAKCNGCGYNEHSSHVLQRR